MTAGGRGIGQTVVVGLAKAGTEIVRLFRSDSSETVSKIESNIHSRYIDANRETTMKVIMIIQE